MPSAGATDGPVCVLGMGRSGTSLTMRVVGMLGIHLGRADTMLPADAHDNRHGYWEQAAIRELNDDLLAELGGTWNHPPPLDRGWHHDPRLSPFKQRARDIVGQHFASDSQWGWKDPRTSLTLPFWREIVGEMRYVICVRNPADVASSLHRRNPKLHPREETMLLWLRYSGHALNETTDERRLLVSFEDWFDRPQRQLGLLAGFLAPDVRTRPIGWEDEARAFLDYEARHHETGVLSVEADQTVPTDVRLFYLALRHLAADRSAAELDAGLRMLTDWWKERDDLRGERDRLGRRTTELEEQLRTHKEWLASIQSSRSWRSTAFLRQLKRRALAARRDTRASSTPR